MACICMKDTPNNGPYYPLGIKKFISYNKIFNYHYEGHDGHGGYTCDYIPVKEYSEIYLRINYPVLYEVNANAEYCKRLFHCPLCGRYFPPISLWEQEQEQEQEHSI